MTRSTSRLGFAALVALLLAGGVLAPAALAQGKKFNPAKLVGSWTVVSITNTAPDGKATQTYGAGDGVLVFDRSGHFVQVLARADVPKFASNNRNTGTADENKAVVQGSLAIYGTYAVSPKDGTLTLHVERSSYPNWNGSDQKRIVTGLTATELKWDIPAPSVGGSSSAVWKRTK
jgi:hypothetical protein